MNNLELNIDQLNIQLNVLEFEENLPSFKAELTVSLRHPTGKFDYSSTDIWFQCKVWEDFMKEIRTNQVEKTLRLSSISEEFILELSSGFININLKETSFNDLSIELKYKSQLATDDRYLLREALLKFSPFVSPDLL